MTLSKIFKSSYFKGALFAMFSFINRGFSFVLLLVLAAYITPGEYGYLSLFSTVVMMIGYFIAMSSEGYLSVAYFREGEDGIKRTFSSILSISIVMTLLMLIIAIVGGAILSQSLSLPLPVLIIAIIISFFTVYNNIILDYYRIKDEIIKYGIISCGTALLNFVASIILVRNCGLSWEGRVYAQLLCAVIVGLYGLIYFLKKRFFVLNIKEYIKPLLFWSIPLIPHAATTFIRQGCDRYIINASHSISDVGLFSFALTLASVITMLGQGFNQTNSVEIFKLLGDENVNTQDKLTGLRRKRYVYILLYTSATIIISFIGYIVVPMILPGYAQSMNYFLVLSFYGLGTCIYLVYTNYLFYFKKTKNLMYITVGSSLLHLVLSLTFTRYSLYFTAIIYVITQTVTASLVAIIAMKVLKKEMEK